MTTFDDLYNKRCVLTGSKHHSRATGNLGITGRIRSTQPDNYGFVYVDWDDNFGNGKYSLLDLIVSIDDQTCEQQWGASDDNKLTISCDNPATTEINGMPVCDDCITIYDQLESIDR